MIPVLIDKHVDITHFVLLPLVMGTFDLCRLAVLTFKTFLTIIHA